PPHPLPFPTRRSSDLEAIAELSQTLTPADADTPRFMYTLGVACAEAGDYTGASRWLHEAGQQAASLGQEQLSAQIAATLRKVERSEEHTSELQSLRHL